MRRGGTATGISIFYAEHKVMHLPFPEPCNILLYRAYRRLLWPRPNAHAAWLALRGHPIRLRQADIVVEGFGRSGNTFAVNALKGQGLRVFSHSHAPATIQKAVKAGKPICFLIRQPEDAIVSTALYWNCSLQRYLEHYIRYHELIGEYLSYLAVFRFENFTNDFNVVIDGLKARYDLNLMRVDHEALTEDVFRIIENQQIEQTGQINEMRVHRPSQERKDRKASLLEQLREHPDLPRALALHALFSQP